jgi:hypothetical protein
MENWWDHPGWEAFCLTKPDVHQIGPLWAGFRAAYEFQHPESRRPARQELGQQQQAAVIQQPQPPVLGPQPVPAASMQPPVFAPRPLVVPFRPPVAVQARPTALEPPPLALEPSQSLTTVTEEPAATTAVITPISQERQPQVEEPQEQEEEPQPGDLTEAQIAAKTAEYKVELERRFNVCKSRQDKELREKWGEIDDWWIPIKPLSIRYTAQFNRIRVSDLLKPEMRWADFPAGHAVAYPDVYQSGHIDEDGDERSRFILDYTDCLQKFKALAESDRTAPPVNARVYSEFAVFDLQSWNTTFAITGSGKSSTGRAKLYVWFNGKRILLLRQLLQDTGMEAAAKSKGRAGSKTATPSTTVSEEVTGATRSARAAAATAAGRIAALAELEAGTGLKRPRGEEAPQPSLQPASETARGREFLRAQAARSLAEAAGQVTTPQQQRGPRQPPETPASLPSFSSIQAGSYPIRGRNLSGLLATVLAYQNCMLALSRQLAAYGSGDQSVDAGARHLGAAIYTEYARIIQQNEEVLRRADFAHLNTAEVEWLRRCFYGPSATGPSRAGGVRPAGH